MTKRDRKFERVFDALDAITAAEHVHNAAEEALINAVHRARSAGGSWAAIGEALGVSAKVAKKRFKDARGVVYLNERTTIILARFANAWRCSLEEALNKVVRAGLPSPENR